MVGLRVQSHRRQSGLCGGMSCATVGSGQVPSVLSCSVSLHKITALHVEHLTVLCPCDLGLLSLSAPPAHSQLGAGLEKGVPLSLIHAQIPRIN